MNVIAKTAGLMAAGLSSLTLMASLAQAAEPSQAPTFQDVASIIANNCGFCHFGGAADALGGVSVDTEEEVVTNAARMFAAVDSGYMPFGDSEWRTTPEGMQLLSYLKSVIPAEPTPPVAAK